MGVNLSIVVPFRPVHVAHRRDEDGSTMAYALTAQNQQALELNRRNGIENEVAFPRYLEKRDRPHTQGAMQNFGDNGFSAITKDIGGE